jgi:hypothetical protein
MSDERFYIRQEFFCARCGQNMTWEKWPNGEDNRYLLMHGSWRCKNSDKVFYAPVTFLTSIPKEMLE